MIRFLASLALVCLSASGYAAERPWLDAHRSPDERATLLLKELTLDEKIALLHGPMALPLAGAPPEQTGLPKEAIWAAGYIPGVPRLGLPALFETDASLGVTNPLGIRGPDVATALPAGLALAATFSSDFAYQSGAVVGAEAHAKGFNVLLGGGMDLTRDPRNGRNFEYLGEDVLLAGQLAGAAVRGTQDQHVIATVKHFALNAHETNRNSVDEQMPMSALRESDLLAFQLAIETGKPGSVMCAYNKVNGDYACTNPWLLNTVLKKDWRYPGWVMSDWGAVHSELDAVNGLDQESGEQLDHAVYFDKPLAAAVASGRVPRARIDDMVRRILRAEFAVGVVEHPPQKQDIDYAAHAQVALTVARNGIVLLKNELQLLPLDPKIRRIAIIGGRAHLGVLSGSGSSQVTPSNGPAIHVPIGGNGGMAHYRDATYFPSSPLQALRKAHPDTQFVFDSGDFPDDAAALAAKCDAAVVFVTRHEMEGYDVPNLRLPNGQDALVEAVSNANRRTIVVLETGNPVEMPWLGKVAGLLAAWYPGQEGGQAIADILTGAFNPAGRLPISFPVDQSQLADPRLPNLGVDEGLPVAVRYAHGADVGYRDYARRNLKTQFAFGFGLTYGSFRYENFKVTGGKTLHVSFDVVNTGARAGVDIPQVYVTHTPAGADLRLVGYARLALAPGERQSVQMGVERRLLSEYQENAHRWNLPGGPYTLRLARAATDLADSREAKLAGETFAD